MIFSDKEDMMKGYIQVYTGDGKGKTTAAIGLAIRAIGAGKKVCIILITLGKPYFIAKEGMLTEEEIKAWGDKLVVYPAGHPPKEYRDMIRKGIDDAIGKRCGSAIGIKSIVKPVCRGSGLA